jgi:hypothetical protein
MTLSLLSTCVFTASLNIPAAGPYGTTPDWISTDLRYATGAALVDIDHDGWLDLVVANGNDMRRERLCVYYNRGNGTYPSAPDWEAPDLRYHGHIDIADVNGDGWPDVAVALLLNEGGPSARVYMNRQGALESTPSWGSGLAAPAFGVAFGDVNGDGRPDLAIATGFPYDNPHAYLNVVHVNVGGTLSTAPSWQSADRWDYMSALWTDSNNDGWLDLVCTGANTDTWLYRNQNGTLQNAASWRTTDNAGQFAIMATCGDVDRDGYRDLIVTDNTQLFRGSGLFRLYRGLAAGDFQAQPSWQYYDGYGSAVALGDVDADGDLDLATGAWWDYTRLFLNNGGGFGAASDWQSAGTSVVEKIVFGDVDNAAIRRAVEHFAPLGGRRLFYLSRQPVRDITRVSVDGVDLDTTEFTFSREHGWVAVNRAPLMAVEVDYLYSLSLDMAITNWDSTKGNYLYYNRLRIDGDCDGNGVVDLDDFDCFDDCLTGPVAGSLTAPCDRFDLDADADVDVKDYLAFSALLAGS